MISFNPGPLHISDMYDIFRTLSMKRAALYIRVSTLDQHPETQLHDLRQMASHRGYQIVAEFTDRITGPKPSGQDSMHDE